MTTRKLTAAAPWLLLPLLCACSTTYVQTERELSAAGFMMKLADTPEKLAHLETLPQNRLFPTRKEGKLVYVYADARDCKCAYFGNQRDYQRYSAITIQQHEVDQEQMAATDVEDASINARMNWDLWGPFARPLFY